MRIAARRKKTAAGLFFSLRRWYNRHIGRDPTHRLGFGGGVLFFVIKRRALLLFGLALVFSLGAALYAARPASLPASGSAERGRATYVLDAGHGGEDGGAVSASGVKESDVNLAVTRELDALLRFLGHDTVLTRKGDVSIHSGGAETLRQKKVSDLKNRVALVNATPDAVLVSIHQNSLPSVPSVHGAQVFYGAAEPSAALALSVQAALNEGVNADNAKHEKQIDPSIYLMKNAACPAILIECGFLSNAAETARLQEPDYQKTLAVAIAAGLLNTEETP